MASSPERRRRGHHSRSSALSAGSTSSHSSMTAGGPATTTTIASSSASFGNVAASSKNPLLQADVTPSDLFTHHTPAQISSHLASLKSQLQTYDAELKSLINNRYEDILSVGNTISAMERSSTSLSRSLHSISAGMIRASDTNARTSSLQPPDSVLPNKQEQEQAQGQERVKYIASLLLVMHEGPDEVWRLLDLSLQPRPSSSADNERSPSEVILQQAKAALKSARQLSLATSLLVLVKHAGEQMQTLPAGVKSLFSHPLANHTTVVGSIEAELKSSLTDLIAHSSIALAAGDYFLPANVLQPCLESTFRTNMLASVSLIRLGASSAGDAATFFLDQRRKVLETWVQEQCNQLSANASAARQRNGPSARRDIGHTVQTCFQEIVEVSLLGERLFGSGVNGGSLLDAVLKGFTDTEAGSAAAQSASSSTELPRCLSSLVPCTSIAAVGSLPSKDQVVASLQGETPLRDALMASALSLSGSAQRNSDVVTEHVKPLTDQLLTQWAPTVLRSSHKTSSVGKARKQFTRSAREYGKLIADVLQSEADLSQSVNALVGSLCANLKRLLDERAAQIFSRQINQWRLDAVEALHDAARTLSAEDYSTKEKHSFFTDLLLADASDKHSARSQKGKASIATDLRDALQGHGARSGLKPFLDCISTGWTGLQAAKQKHMRYLHGGGENATDALHDLDQSWKEKEQEAGWHALFDEMCGMLKTASIASASTGPGLHHQKEDTDEEQVYQHHFARVLLLSNAVRLLATSASPYLRVIRASYDSQVDRFNELLNTVLLARQEALEPWRAYVLDRAAALWLHQSRTDDGTGWEQGLTTRLIHALTYLNEKSYDVIGLVTGAQSGEEGDRARLLETGSMTDLVASLVMRIQELPATSTHGKDLAALAYLLRNSERQDALAALNTPRDTQADDGAVLGSLQPYRLFLGQAGLPVAAEQAGQQSNAAATASAADIRPLMALATPTRRIQGVQVR